MDRAYLAALLSPYGVNQFESFRVVDSSKPNDYRLNIIIDRRYVLRINDPVITEKRLGAIDRLAERYRQIGVKAPRLFQTADGLYLTKAGDHVCYLSEYLDYPTLWEVQDQLTAAQQAAVRQSVLASIGRLSQAYSGVDLQPVFSMWSIIDLAPLDVEIDEKQDNLNLLVQALRNAGAGETAQRAIAFNEANRAKIRQVFSDLPRCVIQGDLNGGNILIENGQFAGIIDFNMAGTEVNINHFCCETNDGMQEEDFEDYSAPEIFDRMQETSRRNLREILAHYTLNEAERSVIRNYWNLVMLSQYPNVCQYIKGLKTHPDKALALIERIVSQEI